MKYENIELAIRNGVGWFRFNKPPLNAIHWEMLQDLEPAFDELASNPEVRVVIIATAIDQHFSAGADLESLRAATPERMQQWVDITHRLAAKLRASPQPVLAAIRGIAVGGGLEMTLHADLRFAERGARLGQPEINIAFIPPIAGTQALVRLVGRSHAFQMLYGGELMDTEKAHSIGLVDVVSEAGRIESDIQAYAERLAEKPANALAAIRRCLIEGGDTTFEEGLKVEKAEANSLSSHPNFQIGLEAFLNKRKADWR